MGVRFVPIQAPKLFLPLQCSIVSSRVQNVQFAVTIMYLLSCIVLQTHNHAYPHNYNTKECIKYATVYLLHSFLCYNLLSQEDRTEETGPRCLPFPILPCGDPLIRLSAQRQFKRFVLHEKNGHADSSVLVSRPACQG